MVIYKDSLPILIIRANYAENKAQYLITRVEQQQRPKAQPQQVPLCGNWSSDRKQGDSEIWNEDI